MPSSDERKDAWAEICRWHAGAGQGRASVLRWHRCVGYARHDGVSVDMTEPPAVAPDAQDIEYIPGVAAVIDGLPMSDAQAAHTQRLLVQMSVEARDALAGASTLAVLNQ